MQIRAFIASFLLVSRTAAILGCLPTKDFTAKFTEQMGGKTMDLLFNTGTFLGKGSFGEVREIKWGNLQAAAKKIAKPYVKVEVRLQETELRNLDALKGTDAAVGYHGCLESRASLFMVQEPLYKDLESATVVAEIKGKLASERLKIYKMIAEKFQLIHDRRITHQDIKPANIMASKPTLDDFRIIDFGLSEVAGEPVKGGTAVFNAPEKVGRQTTATVEQDVWSLALTFVVLESDLLAVFDNISPSCFTQTFDDECLALLLGRMRDALKMSKLDLFIPVIEKALVLQPDRRLPSMKAFADEITKIIPSYSKKPVDRAISLKNFEELTRSKKKVDEFVQAHNPVRAFEEEKAWKKADKFLENNEILYDKQVIQQIEPQKPQEPKIAVNFSPVLKKRKMVKAKDVKDRATGGKNNADLVIVDKKPISKHPVTMKDIKPYEIDESTDPKYPTSEDFLNKKKQVIRRAGQKLITANAFINRASPNHEDLPLKNTLSQLIEKQKREAKEKKVDFTRREYEDIYTKKREPNKRMINQAREENMRRNMLSDDRMERTHTANPLKPNRLQTMPPEDEISEYDPYKYARKKYKVDTNYVNQPTPSDNPSNTFNQDPKVSFPLRLKDPVNAKPLPSFNGKQEFPIPMAESYYSTRHNSDRPFY